MILGNTLSQLVLFVGIILFSLIGARALYWVFTKVFRVFARKTKSQLDDLIIDSIEKPVLALLLLAGFWYGKRVVTMSLGFENLYSQLLSVVFMIVITWLVVRLADAFLANYLLPLARKKNKLDDTLYPVVKGVVNFSLYAIAIVVILQQLGYNVSGLVAGLGIGGLAFALAAQDVLSNFFGGAAVITDKPFKVGDRIVIDNKDGFVRQIGLRTTHMETFDGTRIIFPNKTVASSVLENISVERARRVKLTLGLVYSTTTKQLQRAKELLRLVVKNNTKTDDNSLVHFTNFGPSSLDIQLIYWIKDLDNILDTKDEINMAIKTAFTQEEIEFAYPSQTIYSVACK